MDCSPPSSSVHGISRARVQEWVAIFFSRRSYPSRPRDQPDISCTGRQILFQLHHLGSPHLQISSTRGLGPQHMNFAAVAAKSLQSCPTLYELWEDTNTQSITPTWWEHAKTMIELLIIYEAWLIKSSVLCITLLWWDVIFVAAVDFFLLDAPSTLMCPCSYFYVSMPTPPYMLLSLSRWPSQVNSQKLTWDTDF